MISVRFTLQGWLLRSHIRLWCQNAKVICRRVAWCSFGWWTKPYPGSLLWADSAPAGCGCPFQDGKTGTQLYSPGRNRKHDLIQPALRCSDPSSTARLKEGCLLSWTCLSGQEVRCICFQHDAIQRDATQSISSLCGFLVGDQGRETHVQVWKLGQQGLNHSVTVGETVPGKMMVFSCCHVCEELTGALARLQLSILACEFCTLLGHTSSWSPGRRRLRLCSGSPEVSGGQQPNAAGAQRPAHMLVINATAAWSRPRYSNFGSSRLQLTSFCLEGLVEFLWE